MILIKRCNDSKQYILFITNIKHCDLININHY